MLGHASHEILMHRRMGICPHVNKSKSRVCDESVPFTDKLFGDDLSATLKDKWTLGTSLSPMIKGCSQHNSGKNSPFLGQSSWFHPATKMIL